MSVSPSFRSFVLDQLARTTPGIRARSMFGGVGIYAAELFFALLDDDTLYFKVDDTTRLQFEDWGMGPFRPYREGGEVMGYYEVPADVLEDPEELRAWVEAAIAVARRAKGSRTPQSLRPTLSNDDVYAAGLLNRALDPATQPPEIQAFLRAELDLLREVIKEGMRVLDVGCGTGRHLVLLRDRLRLGVGVDYERSYIAEAARRAGGGHLHFITGDATAIPIVAVFDFAICLTNTWGTMADKAGVLREMRRLAPRPHTRLLSVFSETSVAARREWYRRFGHAVLEETDEYLVTDGGLRSEHFTDARLRSLVGDCTIRPVADIARAVTF